MAGRIQNLPNLHTPEQRGDVIHDTRVTAAARDEGVGDTSVSTTESQDGGQNWTLLGKENGAPAGVERKTEGGVKDQCPDSRLKVPGSRVQGQVQAEVIFLTRL